jgi:dolichol-phosphate mannosyltransferase
VEKILTIVLPTFNEKDNVRPLLAKIRNAFDGKNYDIEMLFVDDSNDNTPEIIKEEAEKDPRIRFLKGPGTGLAPAFIKGFEEAEGKYICCIDTDLQHPPEKIVALLEKALEDKADIVATTRYTRGGSARGLGSLTTFYGIYRRAVSLGMKYFTQIIFIPTRKTSDPLGGFFLFKKSVLDNITLEPKGFKILVEILMRAKYGRVSEIAYTFLPRENDDSKATISQGIEFFKHLWYIFRTIPEAGRFLKFCIVGGSGVFVNIGTLAFLVEIIDMNHKLAYILAIAFSILTNYFLNTVFTYGDRRSETRQESLRRITYYYVVSIAVMFFNFSIYSLLISRFDFHYIPAALVGIIAATLLNFFLATKFIWKLPIKI